MFCALSTPCQEQGLPHALHPSRRLYHDSSQSKKALDVERGGQSRSQRVEKTNAKEAREARYWPHPALERVGILEDPVGDKEVNNIDSRYEQIPRGGSLARSYESSGWCLLPQIDATLNEPVGQ